MAKRNRSTAEDNDGPSDNWKHLLRVGSLLAAVAGMLLLGAFLRAEPPMAQRTDVESSRVSRPFDGLEALTAEGRSEPPAQTPRQAVAEPSEAELDSLANRAQRDLQRIEAQGGFTLKLATVCDPSNARRWVDAVGSDRRLYLLPVLVGDRACFRVCWGSYPTRSAAEGDGTPPAVRAIAGDARQVLAVERVLP